jgi:hypothetical protein
MTWHAVCWRASLSAQEVLIHAWFLCTPPADSQDEDGRVTHLNFRARRFWAHDRSVTWIQPKCNL